MGAAATSSLIGAIALGWALILFYKGYKHKKPPSRFMVALMLVAGFFLSGGIAGHIVNTAGGAAGAGASTMTARVFGIGTPLVIAFLIGVWIVYDWRTKKIEAVTPWLALVAPAMLPVAAGIGAYTAGAASPAVTTIQALLGG